MVGLFCIGVIVATAATLIARSGIQSPIQKRRVRKRLLSDALTGNYQGVTLSTEIGTLHLLPSGAAVPKNLSRHLRSFNTAEEIIDYVYRQYDTALFRWLILHRAGSDEVVKFVRAADETDAEATTRLQEMLPPPLQTQLWELPDSPRPKLWRISHEQENH